MSMGLGWSAHMGLARWPTQCSSPLQTVALRCSRSRHLP